MSKKVLRGGTILIDKDGKSTVLREPTKLATSGKKVTKSETKTPKKSESK